MTQKPVFVLIAVFFFALGACTEPTEPDQDSDEVSYFFEVEVEGTKFRQELAKDFPANEFPLVFAGGFNTSIDKGCIPGVCIFPFYVNMLFSDDLGKQPWEQIEMIQTPTGSYTSHNWYGGSNLNPIPTTGTVTIIKKDLKLGLIQGTFEGEVYKTGTPTPVKIPIKGSFSGKYLPK